ncbi:serine/threonine protein kinase [Yinghuangia sp. ASG 101]|uniref:serine/threonine-protein kinase n=1 Tax=Yinghuangia sp. ASG 101 TaxID=2896848 RepID=UPI001E351756|nr:serine/threonine-protein kinase [Yinghuangia sp. ASG 101]UGQ14563.1 serine/threonine protein kinase [Yinghuangia sp. ASG 101]
MTEASGGAADRVVNDRYRLEEPLGRGGMGTVWLAVDELLHRQVAVKEVRVPGDLDVGEQEVLRERAMREARAAARVVHRNVVTIYDVVEDDDRPWIVMELVRARALDEVVKEDGPLTPDKAAEVGLAVLAALRAAREADVLHRDVKPSNILMAPDGRIVLTDFGIATVLGSATLTATGMLIGSPEYLAPERVLGRRPGAASDLWSLGVTLYQAVEGRSPFQRPSPVETLTAVLTDDAEPARNAGALRPAIEALMRKDPDTRPDEETSERLLAAALKEEAAKRERGTAEDKPRGAGKAAAAGLAAAAASGAAGAASGAEPGGEPGAEAGKSPIPHVPSPTGHQSFARIPAPPAAPPPESRPTAVLGPAGGAASPSVFSPAPEGPDTGAPAAGAGTGGEAPTADLGRPPRPGDTPPMFPLGGFHGSESGADTSAPGEPGAAYPPARRMRGVYAVFAAVAAAAIGAALWIIPSAFGDQDGKSGPVGGTVSTSTSGGPQPGSGDSTASTAVPTFEPWTPTATETTPSSGRTTGGSDRGGSTGDRDGGTPTRTTTRPRTTEPTTVRPPTSTVPTTTSSGPDTPTPTETTPTSSPTGTGSEPTGGPSPPTGGPPSSTDRNSGGPTTE